MRKTTSRMLRAASVIAICAFVAGAEKCRPAEDLTPGLMGTDANQNGIRDDIDRLITEKYASTPEVRRAAENYALALQGLMESESRQEAFEAAQLVNKSISCIYERLPTDANFQLRRDMLKDIKAFTANTQERFAKYWESNSKLAGATFRLADGSACE